MRSGLSGKFHQPIARSLRRQHTGNHKKQESNTSRKADTFYHGYYPILMQKCAFNTLFARATIKSVYFFQNIAEEYYLVIGTGPLPEPNFLQNSINNPRCFETKHCLIGFFPNK
jgi:hypothetical protein